MYDHHIVTFEQLSDIEASIIKDILVDAGEHFKNHDPTTRPMQAEMAYEGRWNKLGKWQDELKGGRV